MYACDEIEEIIVGRGLRSADEYLEADRIGRRYPLNQSQRRAIWRLYELFSERLQQDWLCLRPQRRQHALDVLEADATATRYDAVVVDQAQDLDLVAIRFVRQLCRDPRHLVLVGDSGQSLYQRAFRWDLVERELGEVQRLRLVTGHRCPPQVVAAARAYLDYFPGGDAAGDAVTAHRKRAGRAKPAVIQVNPRAGTASPTADGAHLPGGNGPGAAWTLALAEQVRRAQEEAHALAGQCAVLAPRDADAGEASAVLHRHGIANELVKHGQAVTDHNAVKVLTWHNAKGLEFDAAIVLLPDWSPPPANWRDVMSEEKRESVESWRRAAYVAMTRAVRALVIIRPTVGGSPLLDDFAPDLWDTQTGPAGLLEQAADDMPF